MFRSASFILTDISLMSGAEQLVSRCIARCGAEKATTKDYKNAQALFQQPEAQELLNNAEVVDHLLSGRADVVEHSLLFFSLLYAIPPLYYFLA